MFRKLLDKYSSTTDLNQFLIKGGSLFLLWRVFRKWMILKGQYTVFTQVVSSFYLKTAYVFLKLLGVNVTVDYTSRKLWVTGSINAIEVVYDCLGVNLFFIFAVFIVAYPGKLKDKLWFLPFGFFSIYLLNALRMAALTLIVNRHPSQMDLFHHFIFQGIIYLAIFALWWWFSNLGKKVKTV